MGTTHFKSNVTGKAGTEVISNFATVGDSSTALVGATVTTPAVIATSYVKIGGIYLMSGEVPTNSEASILAAARAIVTIVPKGSMYLNASPGAVWSFTASANCATIA